jgi:hypothetical protein
MNSRKTVIYRTSSIDALGQFQKASGLAPAKADASAARQAQPVATTDARVQQQEFREHGP